MPSEWTQSVTVQPGGKVEVTIPHAKDGSRVTVTVRELDVKSPPKPKRSLGKWAGRIMVMPGFDDPIPGLDI